VSHALGLGGAERSLIGMLWALSRSNNQVDLFLLRHEGELLKMIPPTVNLLSEIPEYTVLSRPMINTLREGHVILTCARIFGKLRAKKYVHDNRLGENGVALEYSHKYTYRFLPPIQPNTEYDVAISYLTPHYITAHKVKANKRICWIHTDYSVMSVDRNSEYRMWSKFDCIVSVSKAAKDSFISVFPGLKKRLIVIENILPENLIREEANEVAMIPNHCAIKLLSIGRFTYAKNFDNVPLICKSLRKKGLDVRWYLIGFGPDEELIRAKIAETGMNEYVVVLGKIDNPYPYINACDLYVQPSRYEGKCVAVREAQMLGKPVVITNYATSSSQVEDGVDGVIVPLDNEQCAREIANILRDSEKMDKLKKACMNRDYSNASEIGKLLALIEYMKNSG